MKILLPFTNVTNKSERHDTHDGFEKKYDSEYVVKHVENFLKKLNNEFKKKNR